jgi:hypothetical protein
MFLPIISLNVKKRVQRKSAENVIRSFGVAE